jgi:hypothetical protein
MGTATGSPVASEAGAALFRYSEVSCASMEKELDNGNILAALAPATIINHAVVNKLSKDLVNAIPLVSGADKQNLKSLIDAATTPPSVTVTDKHVVIQAGPAKLSLPKPKITIGTPKILGGKKKKKKWYEF